MDDLRFFSRFWWWLLFIGAIGAILGALPARFLPPRYENRAQLSVAFDSVHETSWNDQQMESFIDTLISLANAETTLRILADQAKQAGFSFTNAQLNRMLSIDQRFNAVELVARGKTQQETAFLAEHWAAAVLETSYAEQNNLYDALYWKEYNQSLTDCLKWLPAEPAHPFCNLENEAALKEAIQQSHDNYQQSANRAVYFHEFPAQFTIILTQSGKTSSEITPPERGWSMLLGAAIGIGLAFWMIRKNIPQRLIQ
ncbi:MAG: hypothetical protein JW750_03440 [Anaerolineaceae bacterium]|nr:hypothetical protein [Anaerolineaceae bacterium]